MEQATQERGSTPYRGTGLRRISAPDMQLAVELFVDAAATLTPDDQTQRKAFEALMPNMFVMRDKGVSWAQLTNLLSKAGFHLQQSTVRTYYSEMLVRKFDMCQQRLAEQINLLKSIRKETEGVQLANIAPRVAAVMQRNREAAAPRLAEILGDPEIAPPVPNITRTPRPAVTEPGQRPQQRRAGVAAPKPPATPIPRQTQAQPSAGHTGLTERPSVTQPSSRTRGQSTAFQNPDDVGPSVPVLPTAQTTGVRREPIRESTGAVQAAEKPVVFTCMPLQPGIPQLKPREGVNPKVYQEGDMEHPAIKGLILTRDQRVYGALLEYKDMECAEMFMETAEEKRFRVMWRAPIPKTQTSTASSFIQTDMTLFNTSGANAR